MNDIVIINILNIGMWSVEVNGLSYYQANGRKYLLSNEELHHKRKEKGMVIWDYAIHFSHKTWFTRVHLENLLTAMSINRLLYPIPINEEIINSINTNTIKLGFNLL